MINEAAQWGIIIVTFILTMGRTNASLVRRIMELAGTMGRECGRLRARIVELERQIGVDKPE